MTQFDTREMFLSSDYMIDWGCITKSRNFQSLRKKLMREKDNYNTITDIALWLSLENVFKFMEEWVSEIKRA